MIKFTFDNALRIVDVDSTAMEGRTMGDVRDELEKIVAGVFDTALPQDWVDDVRAKTGAYPFGFLWYYAPRMSWGTPFPVSTEACALLARYNKEITR